MNRPVRIGLLRLVDSAPIIIAKSTGMFQDHGLDVQISVEPSWSNIVDKLTYGVLDAALMLPPLALAACAGLHGKKARLVVPMSLSQGGDSIVLGHAAANSLTTRDMLARIRLVEWLRAQPSRPRFAVVHAYSTHNLLLRYWLASGGADPDRDIETVVVAPENMVAALAAGRISGFCASAAWGEVAERQGAGRTLVGTSMIWPFHPETCLCLSAAWADAHPDQRHLLLRAVLRAQILCDQAEAAPAIAAQLADPEGLGLPEHASSAILPGGSGADRIRYHSREVWFPARAHAMWFLSQMRRWGWLDENADLETIAATVYRPDLAASAVEAEGLYAAAGLPSLEGNEMLPMPGDEAFGQRSARSRRSR